MDALVFHTAHIADSPSTLPGLSGTITRSSVPFLQDKDVIRHPLGLDVWLPYRGLLLRSVPSMHNDQQLKRASCRHLSSISNPLITDPRIHSTSSHVYAMRMRLVWHRDKSSDVPTRSIGGMPDPRRALGQQHRSCQALRSQTR